MFCIISFYVYLFHVHISVGLDFPSCKHALIASSTSGNFSLKPTLNGNTALVYCDMINSTHGAMILGNNRENIFNVSNEIYKDTYLVDKIEYENFNEQDVTELLRYSGSCSQTMIYKKKNTNVNLQQILFWDGTLLSSVNDSPDGICKCFIKTVCMDKNDTNKKCYVNGDNKNNNEKIDEGEFSVHSSRLPLKEIRTTDVRGKNRYIEYSLGKLVCTFKLWMKFNVTINNINIDICENKTLESVLKNPIFCSIIFSNRITLKFQAENSIKIINLQKFKDEKKCKEKIIVYVKEDFQMKMCKFIENCKYLCEPTTQFFMDFFQESIQNTSPCDIELF